MGRKKRHLEEGGLVVICEGTDTEYNYFREAIDWAISQGHFPFRRHVLLQSTSEYIKNNPGDRKLNNLHGNRKELRYYTKQEESQADYDKYCGQPTRYLREAQLFLDQDGYEEGWAVFDKDHHSDHAGARELLQKDKRLHAAFSSYSFEQWLLCHFERNCHPYEKSECDKPAGLKMHICGKSTGRSDDCMGQECLGGHLRQQGYIPDYDKAGRGYFMSHTLIDGRISETALVNAAWTRTGVSEETCYMKNPYTDADALVKRIVDDKRCHYWGFPDGTSMEFDGTEISISRESGCLLLTNTGPRQLFIANGNVCYLDPQTHKETNRHSGAIILRTGESKKLSERNGALLSLHAGHDTVIIQL